LWAHCPVPVRRHRVFYAAGLLRELDVYLIM
jgi:hypothetical protein